MDTPQPTPARRIAVAVALAATLLIIFTLVIAEISARQASTNRLGGSLDATPTPCAPVPTATASDTTPAAVGDTAFKLSYAHPAIHQVTPTATPMPDGSTPTLPATPTPTPNNPTPTVVPPTPTASQATPIPTTTPGSAPTASDTPAPTGCATPTPPVIPPSTATASKGDVEIGNTGAYITNLDITKASGDATVHLQKAYADANNIYVWSTIHDEKIDTDAGDQWLTSLTRAGGAAVDFYGSQNYPTGSHDWNDFDHYNGPSIAGNPASLDLIYHVTPVHNGKALPTVDIPFTVPFYAGTTVPFENKAATALGWTVALDKVVTTPSQTRIYVSITPVADNVATVESAQLLIAGKTYQNTVALAVDGKRNGKQSIGFNDALGDAYTLLTPSSLASYQSFADQAGTWTLKVRLNQSGSGGVHGLVSTWDISFTMP